MGVDGSLSVECRRPGRHGSGFQFCNDAYRHVRIEITSHSPLAVGAACHSRGGLGPVWGRLIRAIYPGGAWTGPRRELRNLYKVKILLTGALARHARAPVENIKAIRVVW